MKTKKDKKLTPWEAGQELVKVADALSYASIELKDYPEQKTIVDKARKLIAKAFNAMGTDVFYI